MPDKGTAIGRQPDKHENILKMCNHNYVHSPCFVKRFLPYCIVIS